MLQELHNPDSVLRFARRFTEKPGRLKHRDETSLVYSHTDRQSKELHVAFDFGSEIFKRPFNAGLTRGRQSIQVKSPSRTRLRAHRKGFQNMGATGDVAVANYIYSVANSIDDLRELVKRAPRRADARHDWRP